jgi:hypothetical protein
LKDIEKVEKRALDNRRAIKNWHVRFFLKRIVYRENGPVDDNIDLRSIPGQKKREVYMDCYYDGGDYARLDRFFELGTGASQKLCCDILSWDDKYLYDYTLGMDDEKKGKCAVQVTTRERALEQRGGNMPSFASFDIRVFAMAPSAIFLSDYELTSLISNPDRKDLEMTDDIIDGVACKKISCKRKVGNQTYYRNNTVWIAPEYGYNPIRIMDWNEDRGYRCTVNVKIAKHKESGIWFPVSYVDDATYDGKPYSHSEYQVEIFSFNKKFPKETFTPKGINVPVGTRVLINPPPVEVDNFFWDGEKIAGEFGTVLEPTETPPNNTTRYFFIACGLALISLGCLLKYLELARKNKNKKPPHE